MLLLYSKVYRSPPKEKLEPFSSLLDSKDKILEREIPIKDVEILNVKI